MATVSIYGAGGAGIKIASLLANRDGEKEQGFAVISTFFLDTSDSDLPDKIQDDHVYLIDGLDGSGKDRKANYKIISERSNEMLHRFKPGDVNIVVHSGSGGSGSVIGPVLVSELLKRNAPTIVIVIGSSDSRIEAKNTIDTFKSYEGIAKLRDQPVSMFYCENSIETPRGEVDQKVRAMLMMLTMIFSGDNRGLDSTDIKNFLDYTKLTSYKPALSGLRLFSKNIELGREQSVISLLSLTDSVTDATPPVHVEYSATGFIPEISKEIIEMEMPVHAAIIANAFQPDVERLQARIAAIDETRNTVVQKSLIDTTDLADHTDDGLCL